MKKPVIEAKIVKKESNFYKHVGVIQRLDIDPISFIKYNPMYQEDMILKNIVTHIQPKETENLTKKADKIYQ